MVQQLLLKGVDMTIADGISDRIPLEVASSKRYVGVVSALLDTKPKLDALGKHFESAKVLALSEKHDQVSRMLQDYRIQQSKWTEEHWARKTELTGFLDEYLSSLGSDTTSHIEPLSSASKGVMLKALHSAIVSGKLEAVQWLLEIGAPLNDGLPDCRGRPLLLVALLFSKMEIVKFLLERDTLIEGHTCDEFSCQSYDPLLVAAQLGDVNIFREILNRSENPILEQPIQAIHVAAACGQLEIMKIWWIIT